MRKLGNRKGKIFTFIMSVNLWNSCEVIHISLQKGTMHLFLYTLPITKLLANLYTFITYKQPIPNTNIKGKAFGVNLHF